jgi:hypothetical protein
VGEHPAGLAFVGFVRWRDQWTALAEHQPQSLLDINQRIVGGSCLGGDE